MEVHEMQNRNFYVGMGMGLLVGGCAMRLMRRKKPTMKSALGKTFKTMSEVADSISESMGW